MNKSEIIKACLDIAFGNEPKKSLREFINSALDQGEYFEGFEVAISKSDLDYQEYEELLESFNLAYKDDLPDIDTIEKIIDEHLPQAYFTKLSWLISEGGGIYATDGLRVGKIQDNKLIWVTKRVSYDGINLLSLNKNELVGEWYSPVDEYSPWSELRISTIDGTLVKGEVIEF